jgi:hypothetical protein
MEVVVAVPVGLLFKLFLALLRRLLFLIRWVQLALLLLLVVMAEQAVRHLSAPLIASR